jgi:hypothetical protein
MLPFSRRPYIGKENLTCQIPATLRMAIASGFGHAPHGLTRMGYGAMQLAGPGVFGPPKDRDAAIAVLRKAVDLGIRHIDTGDFYGPYVVNEIIKEALGPYPEGLHVVTKVDARRGDDASWIPSLTPESLIQQVRFRAAGGVGMAATALASHPAHPRYLVGRAPARECGRRLSRAARRRARGTERHRPVADFPGRPVRLRASHPARQDRLHGHISKLGARGRPLCRLGGAYTVER